MGATHDHIWLGFDRGHGVHQRQLQQAQLAVVAGEDIRVGTQRVRQPNGIPFEVDNQHDEAIDTLECFDGKLLVLAIWSSVTGLVVGPPLANLGAA